MVFVYCWSLILYVLNFTDSAFKKKNTKVLVSVFLALPQ